MTSEAASNGRQSRKAERAETINGRSSRTGAGQPTPSRTAIGRARFSAGAAAMDALVVLATALVTSLVYQGEARTWDTMTSSIIVAILFIGTNALRDDYAMHTYLALKGHVERALTAWLIAFGATLTLGFLTKTTAIYSRGATAILFVAGFAMLIICRNLLVRHMRLRAEAGTIVSRTIMLVGVETEILAFLGRYRPEQYGLQVVGASVLRESSDTLRDDLSLAVATARMAPPDDVFLLVPWSDPTLIARSVEVFRQLPCAIHLGPAGFLDRYGEMRIDRAGPISSVHLVGSPMSPTDIITKRAFDIAVASVAVVALSPVLLLAALAVKIESRGPVFFVQRRYGFNQQPFRIIKFRSMTTMEDSAALRQVTTGDRRVTRVGRILRKTSIDELPQLINVLRGEMSIVGPRPHALAHDQQFERMIASYARRHNVRPGITGWAQVRGWRGETDTPEKIQGRIEHDFHYIDNWSFWFDISIIFRTIFSPTTFRNAK
jgi:Undecaprenyl-phosphate glucose phosphotransferase